MTKNRPLIITIVLIAVVLYFSLLRNGVKGIGSTGLVIDKDEVVISMQEGSYVPDEITIKRGTKVTFMNDDTGPRWPASDLHPSHGIYSAFDPRKPIKPEESWSFTFERVGEWGMHDHLAPYIKAEIVVVE